MEWAGHQRDLPRSAQRVLALLALSGRPGRAGVAGQLWPEVNEKRALGSLRTVLHRIQINCPDIVRSCGDHLELAGSVLVDFSEVTSWALSALSDGPGDAVDPAALRVPPGAYRGTLLPGWYDEWVLLEREQFCQLRMHALEETSARLAGVGRYGEALYAAHSAVRAAPLRESAHRAVISIHLAEGNITEAVRQYESFRDMLRTEVGAEPSPLMKRLLGPFAEPVP
ncbi:bacterial transcriptional activator domain-containing protein [Streptomyces sp. H10-C2]|uniref:AfsR/SARP family transcriptional regulator n=1 Tax=Streptomyces sp. PH10-H1 TaxID=3046212 RepID=UPI0024BAC0DF|nr:bacterial transcriptional activator domain-containing protein [Streptomyces sp. PH10-H1]MDJ0344117.1 bacterial transcriptional activator domain-containing protein [Streptomyces sp. PH10-H1]MDJ0374873.1 bacterial transcriptional activator domain-containing protein [Streptomyces sp. H10-C2]